MLEWLPGKTATLVPDSLCDSIFFNDSATPEIYTLLRELAASGAAILLYTSELAELPLVCDRVLIMHDGRIVDEQNAAHATEASLLTAAHGLEVPA